MRPTAMLTTTEAATLAAVGPSTIKRWADQGLLPVARTAGGHRRFERGALERWLAEPREPGAGAGHVAEAGSPHAAWVSCLVRGQRHELDGALLGARARLGRWCDVADELAAALRELGDMWRAGRLSIAEEHMASESLSRALARVGDALPTRLYGSRCLLACAGQDEHTLGLSLAELCLRELGYSGVYLGRRTPVAEVLRLVQAGEVALVALSATAGCEDARTLARIEREVGRACAASGVGLLLGGAGSWPKAPRYGVRVASFAGLHAHLQERAAAPARAPS